MGVVAVLWGPVSWGQKPKLLGLAPAAEMAERVRVRAEKHAPHAPAARAVRAALLAASKIAPSRGRGAERASMPPGEAALGRGRGYTL